MLYLLRYRELITNFVFRDLNQRYVGSLLGIYWSFLNPIITLVIYCVVFGYFFKMRLSGSDNIWDFFLYFAAGFLPWTAFQSTLMRASNAIIDNKSYIKKVPFPSEIFPIYYTIADSVNLLIGIGIYLVLYLLFHGAPHIVIIFLPFVILLQIFFTLSFSFLLSAGTVFFRDIPQILGSVFQVWFWATPIIYNLQIVPEQIKWIILINPMYHIIEIYRGLMLYGVLPDIIMSGLFVILTVVFFIFSLFIFKLTQKGFSELL